MPRIQSLEMVGISKRFGATQANRQVSFHVGAGEILGLLGENGAGKTTLMNVLYGLVPADSGEIRVNGQPVRLASPRDAIAQGIGMVHQHFMLVQNHTVAENIALGLKEAPFFRPARHAAARLSEFGRRYGLEVQPAERIWQLSAGQQQRVEIVKALLKGADLLILDEPTSVLTPGESEELFAILRRMADEGHSIIFISHKLEEILGLCHRVVVLRRGEVAGALAIRDRAPSQGSTTATSASPTSAAPRRTSGVPPAGEAATRGVDKRELARMMVGREVMFRLERKQLARGEPVLEVEELEVPGDRRRLAVRGVTFRVHRHEIFGIAGVSGNGQRELVEAVTGLRRCSGGRVRLGGRDITNASARVVAARGIAHVPEERIRFGVVPNLFVYENAVLKQHYRRVFSRVLFLNFGSIRRHAAGILEQFNVTAPSIDAPVKSLSGGNIQKLILGREISSAPTLLVAAHPTYGLDVGATEYIRRQLLDRREEGLAVLLVSEDLEEIFELCDRIAVIYEGRLVGVLEAAQARVEEIGLMMAGASAGASAGADTGERA